MQPIASDDERRASRVERLWDRRERLERVQRLVADLAAIVQDLHALHARYVASQRQPMSRQEWYAQSSTILSAEMALLQQGLVLRLALHDLLRENRQVVR